MGPSGSGPGGLGEEDGRVALLRGPRGRDGVGTGEEEVGRRTRCWEACDGGSCWRWKAVAAHGRGLRRRAAAGGRGGVTVPFRRDGRGREVPGSLEDGWAQVRAPGCTAAGSMEIVIAPRCNER